MATKKSRRARTEYRKAHIRELRDELNKPNPSDIHPFTKYKLLTYVFVFIFPPYGMYRVWKKDSCFVITEKVAQTLVEIAFIGTLLSFI